MRVQEAFTTWRPLSVAEIEKVPESSGVYELATLVRTVLFIGAAPENLSAEIAQHLTVATAPLVRSGSLYFRFRPADEALNLQSEMLADYTARHNGALPPAQSIPPPPPRPKRHLKAV